MVFGLKPFKQGDIYEDPNITSPEDRLRHFGQADHVRIYSAEGLQKRLQGVGFEVEVLRFTEDSAPRSGLRNNEKVLKAHRR